MGVVPCAIAVQPRGHGKHGTAVAHLDGGANRNERGRAGGPGSATNNKSARKNRFRCVNKDTTENPEKKEIGKRGRGQGIGDGGYR